jgi:hypothetical protein
MTLTSFPFYHDYAYYQWRLVRVLKFRVLTVVRIQTVTLWVMTPCSLTPGDHVLGGTFCLHLRGRWKQLFLQARGHQSTSSISPKHLMEKPTHYGITYNSNTTERHTCESGQLHVTYTNMLRPSTVCLLAKIRMLLVYWFVFLSRDTLKMAKTVTETCWCKYYATKHIHKSAFRWYLNDTWWKNPTANSSKTGLE